MKKTKLAAAGVIALAAGLVLTGCQTDAQTVDQNMTKEAESFKIQRKVTFINGVTDKILAVVEGKCSQTNEGSQLTVLCKVGPGKYEKTFLGLSDNVFYISQPIEATGLSAYYHKIIIKPEAIIPDFDVNTSK